MAIAHARIAVLEEQGSKFATLIEELQTRLGRNASNSSLPPSANPPGAPKPGGKKPSGRKVGGQPGHKGHQYRMTDTQMMSKTTFP